MDPKTITHQIKDFLIQSFPNPKQELTEETDLINDWLVESLRIVMVVDFIEKAFNIKFQQADINGQNFETLASLVKFVEQQSSRSVE